MFVGPPTIPILGSIPFIPSKLIHYTMADEWKKKYGPLVGLVLGKSRVVAVCGPTEIFEVLRRDEFQGRPKGEFIKQRSFNKNIGKFN